MPDAITKCDSLGGFVAAPRDMDELVFLQNLVYVFISADGEQTQSYLPLSKRKINHRTLNMQSILIIFPYHNFIIKSVLFTLDDANNMGKLQ